MFVFYFLVLWLVHFGEDYFSSSIYLKEGLFCVKMKILLVYPPFCTPASPPHSLVHLYQFLRDNLDSSFDLKIMDLNAVFHNMKWKDVGDYFRRFNTNYSAEEYERISKAYMKESTLTYAENNKRVVHGENPELCDELIRQLIDQKPNVVAMSIVYSSQVFYAYSLLLKLRALGIKTIVGGPAVNQKLKDAATLTLSNEVELLEEVSGKKVEHAHLKVDGALDFSVLNWKEYFVPEAVLPLRTSISCYYKQCAFCTHHGNRKYVELPLTELRDTLIRSGSKKVFFMDDMIPRKRLLEIAAVLKPLQVLWMCQLRPTRDLDVETLKILHDSGLVSIIWGVEAGSDRILTLMKKGTNVEDIKRVLKCSADAGVLNCLYILFGFPTETKEEFKETIALLRENKEIISMVISTIFGLQQDAPIFVDPHHYGVEKIEFKERTILEPKIVYTVSCGLSQEEATVLRKRYKHFLEGMNKYPAAMNFFREHFLCLKR